MQRDARAGLVGAIFGLVFVLVNAGDLGSAYRLPVRVLGSIAFVAVVVLLVRFGGNEEEARVEPRAWRIYWIAVAVEAVALVGGANIWTRTGHQDLSLPWVTLVVGVHFVPLAYAFRQQFYGALAALLVLLAVIGGALALADVDKAVVSFVAGVLAGLSLMVVATRPAFVNRPATASLEADRSSPEPPTI